LEDHQTNKQADSGLQTSQHNSMIDAEYVSAPLKNGTQVGDTTIKALVCASFSGYTYIGFKSGVKNPHIMQEYFPAEISVRDSDHVALLLRDESVSHEFEFGLRRFTRLAKTLQTKNGKVVSVAEQNDTVYYVADFDFRCTFKSIIESGKRVPGENIVQWLKNCLEYLDQPHHFNLLHLGIQSDSILIDANGEAILVGFNSVGPSFTIDSSRPEYTYLPIERIRADAEMLPASDFYSLAAVLLHGMTGREPVHAARRSGAVAAGRADPLAEQFSELEDLYDKKLLSVLKWMLLPQPMERPQSVEQIFAKLSGNDKEFTPAVRKTIPQAKQQQSKLVQPEKGSPSLEKQTDQTPVPMAETLEPVDQHKVANEITSKSAVVEIPELSELHERTPQNWFQDEDERHTRTNILSLVLNSPYTWFVVAVLSILLAWWWLGTDATNQNVIDSTNDVPSINVVPRSETPAKPTTTIEQEPTTASSIESSIEKSPLDLPIDSGESSSPQIVLEPESEISEIGDAERAQRFEKLAALERRLEPYLVEADAHFQNGRLLEPGNANALKSYEKILSMDAENSTAKAGIKAIIERTLTSTDSLIKNGDIDSAKNNLARLSEVSPGNSKIEELQRSINEIVLQQQLEAEAVRKEQEKLAKLEQEEESKRQSLQSLMSKAISSFDSSQLVEPPLENALYYYRKMLELDPSSIPASAGIAQIAATFLRQAKQSIGISDFDIADRNLTTAAAIDPSNAEIPILRSQINTQRRLAEQERIALQEAELRRGEAETAANQQLQLNLQSGIKAYYDGEYIESYNYLKPLSDRGVARAQFRVAMMYEYGRGLQPNKAEARKLFLVALEDIRELSKSGVSWAQADLGSYYEDGIIINQDYRTAANWYYQSAEQGYSGAQTNLGVLFANGHGVNPDMKKAVEWFKRAALQGDRVAKENLTILGYDPEKIILGE